MTDAVILCGDAKPDGPLSPDREVISLKLHRPNANATLKIRDIHDRLASNISNRLIDLLEIAAYVYVADQSVGRGSPNAVDFGDSWRRRLSFHIPVRDLGFWSQSTVCSSLIDTLTFLSDDEFNFQFLSFNKPPPIQEYLELGTGCEDLKPETVMLFSGGLDSLGGLIREVLDEKRPTVLVSHRSTPKTFGPVEDLLTQFRSKCPPERLCHVPVWIYKGAKLTRAFEQRTRSFLYSALATVVARIFELDRIKFYENGITSFNLPIAEQVIGSKATRTTHPRVLNDFSKLYSLIADADFQVLAPFVWKTKEDVVRYIGNQNCQDLISLSNSCTHTYEKSKAHTHCGRCSQCLERRFAVLGAGLAASDPGDKYAVDLLTGDRKDGVDRAMAVGYVQRARILGQITDAQIFEKFPELHRILPYLDVPRAQAIKDSIDLLRRHSSQIGKVLEDGIKCYAKDLRQRNVPPTSLLFMAITDPALVEQPPAIERTPAPSFHKLEKDWEMSFDGITRHFIPMKGFDIIAQLLAQPGSDIHCLELVHMTEASHRDSSFIEAPAVMDEEVVTHQNMHEIKGEEAFDDRTHDTLRQKLLELSEARREAEELHDSRRIEEINAEFSQIEEYLRRGTGLKGKRRKLGTTDEKARKSVCRSVEYAIDKIGRRHESLSQHLRTSIVKGTFLSYKPSQPIPWTLA